MQRISENAVLSYFLSDSSLPLVSVLALSTTSGPRSSALATVASNSSILRSKAVSWVSIAEAVLSPLAPTDSTGQLDWP